MPHSPKNRAKRQKISNLIDQENFLTDQIITSNTNIISITNLTTNSAIIINQLSNPTNMPGNQHIQASNSNQIDQAIFLSDHIPLLTTTTTSSITATNLATTNSHQITNETNMHPINHFLRASNMEPTIVQTTLETPANLNNTSSLPNSNQIDQAISITDHISLPTTTTTSNISATNLTTTNSHQLTNEINMQPFSHLQASNMEPTIVQPTLEILVNLNNNSSLPNSNQIDQAISITDHISLLTTTTTPNISATNPATNNSHQLTNTTNMQPINHFLQVSNRELAHFQMNFETTANINNTSSSLHTNNSPPTLSLKTPPSLQSLQQQPTPAQLHRKPSSLRN